MSLESISQLSEEIREAGLKVFGDSPRFSHWLYIKNSYIDNQRPIDVADNDKYKTLILDELNRIEHSEFS